MQLSSISLGISRLFGAGNGAFAGATLNIDFRSGNNTLDPRITFLRSTTATYYDSTGVLRITPFNLLTYSEQFDNAVWIKAAGAVLDADQAVAPDGSTTADKFSVGTSTFPQVTQSATATVSLSHVGSVYFKAAGLNFVQLRIRDALSQSNFFRVILNLQDGSISLPLGGGSGVIGTIQVQSLSNGWWRLSLAGVANTSGTSLQLVIILTKDANATVATPTNSAATDGIFLWGAQLETGSTSTTYIPTQAAASGAPRFDYDPVTLAPMGLLIEEQRVNLLTYSEKFEAPAWVRTRSTVTTNTVVSPDGTQDASTLTGDGTGVGYTYQGVTLTQNVAYAFSVYVKAGTFSGSISVKDYTQTGEASFNLSTLATSVSGICSSATAQSVGNGWYRLTGIMTPTIATGTHNLAVGNFNAAATIYIWSAQAEAGAFPTSYIPTVASQVTRAPDNASMLGTNFSSWYNQSAGTVYAEFVQGVTGSATGPVQALGAWSAADSSLGSTFNGYGVRISINVSNVSNIQFTGRSGATAQNATSTIGGFVVAGTTYKTASAWNSTDMVFSRSGAVGTTSANTVASTLTTQDVLRIGTQTVGGSPPYFLNGHIKRIVFYPRRLTNVELQGITS
jgi:hypothetical protein